MKVSGACDGGETFATWHPKVVEFLVSPSARSDAVTAALSALNRFCGLYQKLMPNINDMIDQHLRCAQLMLKNAHLLVTRVLPGLKPQMQDRFTQRLLKSQDFFSKACGDGFLPSFDLLTGAFLKKTSEHELPLDLYGLLLVMPFSAEEKKAIEEKYMLGDLQQKLCVVFQVLQDGVKLQTAGELRVCLSSTQPVLAKVMDGLQKLKAEEVTEGKKWIQGQIVDNVLADLVRKVSALVTGCVNNIPDGWENMSLVLISFLGLWDGNWPAHAELECGVTSCGVHYYHRFSP